MPKLTMQQATELLQTLGVKGVQVVENESDSDYVESELIDMVDASRGSILKAKITEDMEAESRSIAMGTTRRNIIKTVRDITGIERKKLEDIEDVNELIKLAVNHTKSLSEGSKESVQQEIDKILQSTAAEKEGLIAEWKAKYDDLNGRYVDRDITGYVKGKLKDAPLKPDADRDILSADFKRHLANKYHLTYDEVNAAVSFFKKDNPAIPAIDGNKHIDFMKEAQEFFEPRGLWVKDMRGVVPTPPAGAPYQPANPPAPNPMGKQPAANLKALNDAVNAHIAQQIPTNK